MDWVGKESKGGCLDVGWGNVTWGTCTRSRWILEGWSWGKFSGGWGWSFYVRILK